MGYINENLLRASKIQHLRNPIYTLHLQEENVHSFYHFKCGLYHKWCSHGKGVTYLMAKIYIVLSDPLVALDSWSYVNIWIISLHDVSAILSCVLSQLLREIEFFLCDGTKVGSYYHRCRLTHCNGYKHDILPSPTLDIGIGPPLCLCYHVHQSIKTIMLYFVKLVQYHKLQLCKLHFLIFWCTTKQSFDIIIRF